MRTSNLRLVSFVTFLAFTLSTAALAQYSIQKIEIHGVAPYTETEVLEVSGLQPRQMMSHDSLGNAAQHLLDTGVFADASIELTGTGMARTVVITLKPLPVSSLTAATFANFPWWTTSELDAAIRQRVPFYRGGIPPAGNLPDSVNAALTAMLAEKGIHATVSNASIPATNLHPQLAWEFHLDDPAVRLVSLSLRGTPAPFAPAMQRIAQHLSGSRFNDRTVADQILAPLHDAGYIDAELTNVSATLEPASSGYAVRYSATIVPGDIFRVNSITWQPTSIYAQDAFTHDAKLHSGDLASQKSLLETEQAILNAYLHLGYLDAFVDAHPQKDASAHTVSYSLAITPGEIYHVKSITPLNLSAAAQKDFDFGWLLKPGAAYDPLYTATFLTNNTALRSLAGYTASFQAAADSQTHLVDLTINFIRTGGGE
ncbi:MAG TPA: POTRA domain-containing protein [Acidobacteriaceae bacterium]|nr:POTRA domain-containing protein [Acidobacteriaceae bacterium]